MKDVTLILSNAGALSITDEGYTDVDLKVMLDVLLLSLDSEDFYTCKYILNFLGGIIREIEDENPGIERLP